MVSLLENLPSTMPSLSRFRDRPEVLRRAFSRVAVRVPDVLRPRNPDRRRACRYDFLRFCRSYFTAKIFCNPSRFHLEFIAELQRLALSPIKETKALAAPRGVGKSMLLQLFDCWCKCYSHRNVFMWVCVNKKKASERLDFVKQQFLSNELLFEDFPELCQPVRDFGGDPRCSHPYTWTDEAFNLANGKWSIACGIEGAILGTLIDGMRIDFVAIDDPEDSETVQSETQTNMRRNRIEKEICYLGALGQRISIVMITTIRAIDCLSHEYTDKSRRPDWEGQVYRAVETFPERGDLWDRYMAIVGPRNPGAKLDAPGELPDDATTCQRLNIPGEKWDAYLAKSNGVARTVGLKFVAANYDAMHSGARLLDESRIPLHDFYFEMANAGRAAVFSELQNDPLGNDNVVTLQLTENEVTARGIEIPIGRIPNWSRYLLVNIDVGLRRLHWGVTAWDEVVQTPHVAAIGVQETRVNEGGRYDMARGSSEARALLREDALKDALLEIETHVSRGFTSENGTRLFPSYIGVDIGGAADKDDWQDIILPFCRERYPLWIPMKGAAPWRDPIAERADGRNFIFEDPKRNPLGRMDWNSNFYRSRMYERYKTPMNFDANGRPQQGAITLFRDDPLAGAGLTEFAMHMTAERYVEEYHEGKQVEKSLVKRWVARRRENHWFDTSAMAEALADLLRVMLAAVRPVSVSGAPDQAVPARRNRERW